MKKLEEPCISIAVSQNFPQARMGAQGGKQEDMNPLFTSGGLHLFQTQLNDSFKMFLFFLSVHERVLLPLYLMIIVLSESSDKHGASRLIRN